ncbi:MAG: GHKL domain-containing protein [Parachlamydiaceae bacterium]|nr:GHKL domain-containing protein [Parachlamydiaceae bacterium]
MVESLFSPLHLNSSEKGILFVNLDGTVTAYNDTAEDLLNVPREKVLFHPFEESFSDTVFGFSLQQALKDKKVPSTRSSIAETVNPLEVDATILLRDKNTSTPLKPLNLTIPVVEGLIILVRDISELRRLQAIAQRNDRMKELEKMAALIAHEIRNPLGGIKGFAGLLQRDLKGNDDLYKLATHIVEGTENLNRLVYKILGYAKPLKLDLEPHNLVTVLKELLLYLNADASIDPRIIIDLKYSHDTLLVLIDPESLKEALLNLTNNAIQAMSQGGNLCIEVAESAHEAMVKVSDTGEGIPKENMAKIFTPLFTTRPEGHGFGLTEVHKIVHALNGEIELFSKVGNGTTFVIHLPKIESESILIASSV